MPHADFVHLRVHSAYSLSEGALKIPDIVTECRAGDMPAVAITDTGNLFGALEFAQACAKAGVQPIIGCQIGVARGAASGERANGGASGYRNGNGNVHKPAAAPDQIVLLAQTEAGYRHLLKLVSKAFLEGDPGEKPQVALDDLRAHNDGLIALTGGPAGPVGRLLLEGKAEAAAAMAKELAEIFDGRLYVELMRHNMPAETAIEAGLIDIAYAQNLPLVATNEAFFADASMYEAHDALLCIAEGRTIAEQERRRLTPEHRFKSAAEMKALFADLPEAIANTLVIARRCAVMPEPRAPILPTFTTESGLSEADELAAQAREGLEKRLQSAVFEEGMDDEAREAAARPYRERLEFELGMIADMGFPGYFLIVADFIQWANAHGIPVGPGRGSGAGSVVAWALTITGLDPLRWGLLFERFLNPERVSMPDFDIDFCQDRRDEVIAYVQDKYGHDRVAQIITFGKLQARAVLRDVGRVMGLPWGQVDRICKLVPNNPAAPVTLQQAIDGEPDLQRQQHEDLEIGRLIDIGLKLEGLYRHASTHAAGVVIGDRPLDELAPLYRDPRSSMPVTQFNMKWVEMAGLVKFDFLGLKTLTVLAQAVALIRARGEAIDLEAIPLDDAKSYEMMGRAETTGVFQLESAGMRDVLRKLKPDRFEDIIAVVALYRPGPMENIPSYIKRKHGQEKVAYLHDDLAPVLKETFGIPIYQEQVQQMARDLAGYTLGGADLLRRAMGKKIKAEMDAQRATFVDGAKTHSEVGAALAGRVFDQMAAFAGYGFNKSHAAAYALVAYQTAYLKANYPVEFLAASMTLDLGSIDKLNGFRRELDRLTIKLLPPDVNASGPTFTVETLADGSSAIRYALAALKNVGHQAMADLAAEREAGGPFASIGDFAARLDTGILNKRQMESLVSAGAFDTLEPNRKRVYDGIERILRHVSAAANERSSAQSNLFGGADTSDAPAVVLPETPEWLQADRLKHEFEAIGFYLSSHPLEAYETGLERLGVVASATLGDHVKSGESRTLRLAGAVIGRKERTTSRGGRMAFVHLSDRSGAYEITAFSEVLNLSREMLDQSMEAGAPVLVTAEVRSDEQTLRITAERIQRLDDALAGTTSGFRIYLEDDRALAPLMSLIERQSKGKGRLRLIVDADEDEVEIALPGAFALSPATRAAIKAIHGIAQVAEV
ncbi:MAG TPA: DNA polymerase III subunit alpha [Alphaproteobacteria bacterium]|nr:DNA polymerase III subunit alpha [Alphaproteobacteria bacterium]